MIDLILVDPPVTFSARFGKLARAGSFWPSLGLAFLAAVARDEGFSVKIIDSNALGLSGKSLVNIILKENLKINWDVRARVNTVDEELLELMGKAGCKRIHYGVESGTQKILNVLRKGITLKMAEDAFRWTKKAGIQTLGYFMIGSPEEKENDIKETNKFIKKISPDYIHVSITTPFPATDLYDLALKEKVIKEDVWKKFAQNPTEDFIAPLWEKEMPREKLFSLLKKIYRSFYFRPSYIIKRIIHLGSIKELINKSLAALKLLRA